MKLQLDHKALTALIKEAGPEFELEIRQGVLNTACRKAVKSIVPEEAQRIIAHLVEAEVETMIGTIKFMGGNGYKYNITLNPKIQSKIADEVRDSIGDYLKLLIDAAIKKALDFYNDAYISQLVDYKIKGHVNALVTAKFAQVLAA